MPAIYLRSLSAGVVGNSAAQVAHPRTGTNGNGGGIYSSGTVTLNNTTSSRNGAMGPTAPPVTPVGFTLIKA